MSEIPKNINGNLQMNAQACQVKSILYYALVPELGNILAVYGNRRQGYLYYDRKRLLTRPQDPIIPNTAI